jgi:hypothetical protein
MVYENEARPISGMEFVGFLGFEFRPVYTINLSAYPKGEAIGFDFFFAPTPSGTLLNKDETIYLVTDTGLAPFPSEAVYRSWGYDFSMVTEVNIEDAKREAVAPIKFRDGSVVSDAGTVYLVSGGAKFGFKTWEGFLSAGYSPSVILEGSLAEYPLADTFE